MATPPSEAWARKFPVRTPKSQRLSAVCDGRAVSDPVVVAQFFANGRARNIKAERKRSCAAARQSAEWCRRLHRFADSSRSSIPNFFRGLMSQTESPEEFELDRLRTAVQDYEKKLSEAADLVAR